ncbi:glycosyltransferase [Streptosporangium sp. NPDC050855]|uniref:glycosyltransferase n=1 Tax=Streptosporangium sp. NPDC050855 TaxID=3366194 RepID=UPI00378D923B
MRVCVATIVHHPEDARIMHRQIRALLDAGHEITYVAPFTDCNVTPDPPIRAIDVPRAIGNRRGRSIKAARRALARGVEGADLLIVHDLELLFRLPGRRPVTVWDVRAAAVQDAGSGPAWHPRRALSALVRRVEARAERDLRLILSEESLRDRFDRPHPVVPDAAYVPALPPAPPGRNRVVHIGHLSEAGGVDELIGMARALLPYGIRLDLIGSADARVRPMLRDAQRQGLLDWYGHVPNRHALRMAEGAIAGLSLPRRAPGRPPLPAKVIDYMSRGIPVVSTPLPAVTALVERTGCGTVVPYGDADAAVRAVLALRDDPAGAAEMGARGHAEALAHHNWPDKAGEFIGMLEEWAGKTVTSRLEIGVLEAWHVI